MLITGEETSTREVFEGRKEFDDIQFDDIPGVRNFWETPNDKYGLLNHEEEYVYPNEEFVVTRDTPVGQTVKLLDVTYEALVDFLEYFNEAQLNGDIRPQSEILPFEIGKTYESLMSGYNNYVNTFMRDSFVESYLSRKWVRDWELVDIDSFFDKFLEFAETQERHPFLFSEYYQSKFVRNYQTGLTVDLRSGLSNGDQKEAAKFYRDDEFGVYLNAVKKFGFLMHENSPWKITLDLQSPYIRDKFDEKNLEGYEEFFETRYNVLTPRFEGFRNIFYNFYNSFVEENDYRVYFKDNGQRVCKNVVRREPKRSISSANDKKWINNYFDYLQRTNIEDTEKIRRDTLQIYDSLGMEKAQRYASVVFYETSFWS